MKDGKGKERGGNRRGRRKTREKRRDDINEKEMRGNIRKAGKEEKKR